MILRDKLLNEIKEGKYSLVVLNNNCDEILFTSTETGIKGLFKLVRDHKEELKSSYILDKVIGSAAGFLMAYAEIDTCYGLTMSSRACDIFEGNLIKYTFDKEVEFVMKNEQELCLMEQLVSDKKTKEEAYEALCEFFKDKL